MDLVGLTSCSPRCMAQLELLRLTPTRPALRSTWASERHMGATSIAYQRRQPRQANIVSATAPEAAAAAEEVPRLNAALDDTLSKRPLELDPAGYFIIKVDREQQEIVAEYFTNIINEKGLACDPVTGEVIPCTPGYRRPPSRVFRGRSAKEISVEILEKEQGFQPVTHLEHANYLGREFQRAEAALIGGQQYIQD